MPTIRGVRPPDPCTRCTLRRDLENVDVDYGDDDIKNLVACDYGSASRPHTYTPELPITSPHREPYPGAEQSELPRPCE